jgi:hypothetical protein
MDIGRADLKKVFGPFGAVASAICLISLVLVPVVRAHDFAEHFRLNQARREAIRHIAVETAPVQGAEPKARILPAWNPILPIVMQPQVNTVLGIFVLPSVPINRMLMRCKVRVSALSDPDPLL